MEVKCFFATPSNYLFCLNQWSPLSPLASFSSTLLTSFNSFSIQIDIMAKILHKLRKFNGKPKFLSRRHLLVIFPFPIFQFASGQLYLSNRKDTGYSLIHILMPEPFFSNL